MFSMDKISKEARSALMAKIKGKETKIEVLFRKELWKAGYRYRKNVSGYFGKPDVLLRKYKLVIFTDSCFWHGCPRHFRMPATNKKYWKEKIERNRTRDRAVNRHYKKMGWKVFRIWEHNFKDNLPKNIQKVIDYLRKIDQENAIV
jgi:DNA mismatch endonuclease (patch repair protein)